MKKQIIKISKVLLFLFFANNIAVGQSPSEILSAELNSHWVKNDSSLFQYILSKTKKLHLSRKEEFRKSLLSKSSAIHRIEGLKRLHLSGIPEFPQKNPLIPIITGKIETENYTIEKVIFQSRPFHYVTAHTYIPKKINSKVPGIYIPCGHSSNGKNAEFYQKAAALFATEGFVVVIADPINQGERYQYLDSLGKPINREGTFAHALLDVAANFLGQDIALYELWDNIRGIDYLMSRPEVDSDKIGVSGNSGGGTQATFLASYDDRIKAFAPSCYVASKEAKFPTRGPQDGCQQLFGETKNKIEEQDYLMMAAPKPILLLAAEKDFFPIAGTRTAFAEMQGLYTVLGYPDRVSMFSVNNAHGWHKPLREKAVQWMTKWLKEDDKFIIEPNLKVFSDEELNCTPTGQVNHLFSESISTLDLLNKQSENSYKLKSVFQNKSTSEQLLTQIKKLVGYADSDLYTFEKKIIVVNPGCNIQKIRFKHSNGIFTSGWFFEKPSAKSAKIIIPESGWKSYFNESGTIDSILNSEQSVFVMDVSGVGETKDNLFNMNRHYWNEEFRNAKLGLFLGESLIKYKIQDITTAIKLVKRLCNMKSENIEIETSGTLCPAALHAVAFSKGIKELILKDGMSSWREVINNPFSRENYPHLVFDALNYYDLPDLHQLIGADKITIINTPNKE